MSCTLLTEKLKTVCPCVVLLTKCLIKLRELIVLDLAHSYMLGPHKISFSFSAFLAFFIVQLEDSDRKQGKRGGVMDSKGTRARSQTWVRCSTSAHGTCMPPTELSGTP